jgi:hypothetical protein
MDAELADRIAKLPTLSKTQLLPIWAENFKTSPPPNLRKDLMVPILAYRMQEGNTVAFPTVLGPPEKDSRLSADTEGARSG